MEDQDPLRSLLVDADAIDRQRLADALDGLAAIDEKTGRIVFNRTFEQLDSKKKLLVFFLARKVAHLLGILETEEIAPRDIPDRVGMPIGTIHPTLKKMRENRLVARDSDAGYWIRPHQVNNCLIVLDKD